MFKKRRVCIATNIATTLARKVYVHQKRDRITRFKSPRRVKSKKGYNEVRARGVLPVC